MRPEKILLITGILILIAVFFIFDLHQYLTLDGLKAQQQRFLQLDSEFPIIVKVVYFLCYVAVAALSLPGAIIMTLAGGALFGALTGTVLVSFASTLGATLAMMAARYLFRDTIQSRYQNRLGAINRGMEKEGGFYLFTLRLIPVAPFFMVNLVMGLTPIKTGTFALVSQLGMLPATIIYVNAGHHLAHLNSLKDIISLPVVLSLAALGLFPLLAKKLVGLYKKRHGKQV